jgi:DNA-binding MarR family transcriptional regulator
MDEKRKGIDTSGVDGIIGYRLRRAQMAVFARFLQRFAETELKPADYSTLVLVADNPGLRPSQVAAVLGIKRANFVALANSLEARGLIDRKQMSADRRAEALRLTPAGHDLVTRLRRIQEQFEAELVGELGGTAERDRLLALLARLR